MSSLFSHSNRGFSLLEMMVVLAIFGIITAVVLADLPTFRDKTTLDLIAQEVATTIRQAQVYGIGTRAAGGASSFPAHGIYFDLTAADGKKSFILYADNGDISHKDQYGTAVAADQTVEKFAIRGAAEITLLQGCPNTPPCSTLATLDILFQRPYTEASFPGGSYSFVRVVIQSTRTNNQRAVEVWNTGQIVVPKS